MKIMFNSLERCFFKYEQEYEEKVLNVLKSGWYILGRELENFESEFAEYIGSKYCKGLNSGLDALTLSLRALGIGKGDEVIVPANTYIASVLAITINGAKPVFVEPDQYYNIDTSRIEKEINSKTKAILVVHLYGQAADMEKICEISDRNKLYLIEDCAQSHGSKFRNKMTGTFGDIGCFSFYPTKNLGAFGDGGAIVTNNKKLNERISVLRNYGSRKKYYNEIVGVNSRLDEIQAGLLRVKLKHIGELREERERICNRYLKEIKNKKIVLPKVRNNSEMIWHLFVVRVSNRNKFSRYLGENGIETRIHYPIPPHLSGAYRSLGYTKGDFPITERYASDVISLPVYDGMTEEEIDFVIEVVNKYEQ